MQGLLNAGLSKTLVTTVMRTQDTESFLAAAEALLVKEPISSATASLLWDEAAVKIGAPPGAVRSRAAFVALVDISTLASRLASGEMLQGWQAPLNSRPLWSESQGFLEFLQRFGTGERYFWIMEGASIASLMWAASLPTSSAAGKALKTALRMVLSDLFSALATAATTGQPLSALHASFKQAIFTEDLDQPTMDIIRSLGPAWAMRTCKDSNHRRLSARSRARIRLPRGRGLSPLGSARMMKILIRPDRYHKNPPFFSA